MSVISPAQINDGDAVTAASVNNPINTIANDYNGNITAANLASGAVTTVKIADANVTNAKLSTTAGEIGSAWQTYTPTITANAGTFTTTSATGKYTQMGKTVFAEFQVTVTTVGTAAGSVLATLPVTPKDTSLTYLGSGRENAATGKQLQVRVRTPNIAEIYFYDGTFPGASGNILVCSVTYEVA